MNGYRKNCNTHTEWYHACESYHASAYRGQHTSKTDKISYAPTAPGGTQ